MLTKTSSSLTILYSDQFFSEGHNILMGLLKSFFKFLFPSEKKTKEYDSMITRNPRTYLTLKFENKDMINDMQFTI